MSVMKVKTDIFVSIAASLIWQAVMLFIIYVKTFKTDVIVYIGNVIMCLTSHWVTDPYYTLITFDKVDTIIYKPRRSDNDQGMEKKLLKDNDQGKHPM